MPAIAKELKLRGKTILRFVVNRDGSIQDVKVLRTMIDCPECDREAVNVIKNMPCWIPAKKQGKIVRSYVVLPIAFFNY